MAGTDSIEVYFGEDVDIPFVMSEDGVPLDISGWAITMTIRGSGISLEIEGVITSALDGAFAFSLLNNDYLSIFRVGSYSYDVWRTDEGQERCIAAGVFAFLAVSRVAAD